MQTAAVAETMHINTGDAKPIKIQPYKLPEKERAVLKETVSQQLDQGVISPSKSAWSAPAFVAWRKAYGSMEEAKPCKVIDYRKLHAVTPPNPYPLPDISNLLKWLSSHSYFGAIDCKAGYW